MKWRLMNGHFNRDRCRQVRPAGIVANRKTCSPLARMGFYFKESSNKHRKVKFKYYLQQGCRLYISKLLVVKKAHLRLRSIFIALNTFVKRVSQELHVGV